MRFAGARSRDRKISITWNGAMTYGVPRLSSGNTGAGPLGYYQIVQTPSYVCCFSKPSRSSHDLSGRAPHLPSPSGVARGFAGTLGRKTLVVDTTTFSASNNFMDLPITCISLNASRPVAP